MYKNILVPIAFDDDAKVTAALDVARQLADEKTQITLLHVMEHIPGYAITYVPQEYLTESRGAVQSELDDLASKLNHATGVVIEGHSGRSIADFSDTNDIDCIVVASHRPGMQDLLLGSTAAYVVRHAKCAVHVVR